MSLQHLQPQVPCSVCGKIMVPVGKMGDTGTKKCSQCLYLERAAYHKRYYHTRHQFKELKCIRCGKKYQEKNGVEICSICRMLAVDLYRVSQQQECIYCGKPSGSRKFCSHNCLVKTAKLAKKRDLEINEMIVD